MESEKPVEETGTDTGPWKLLKTDHKLFPLKLGWKLQKSFYLFNGQGYIKRKSYWISQTFYIHNSFWKSHRNTYVRVGGGHPLGPGWDLKAPSGRQLSFIRESPGQN